MSWTPSTKTAKSSYPNVSGRQPKANRLATRPNIGEPAYTAVRPPVLLPMRAPHTPPDGRYMENHAIVDDNNESTPPDFDWNAEKLVSSIEKLAVDFVNDGTLAQPTFPSEILDTLSEDDIALIQVSGT